MSKKIKNVLTQKKSVIIYGPKTAAFNVKTKLVHLSKERALTISSDIEIIDSNKLLPKIIVSSRYGVLDSKITRAPFTNKVKRLARDKKKHDNV